MTDKQDGRKVDRKILESIRINAIMRWIDGEEPVGIIQSIGFCETTIYKWIDLYEGGGFEALYSTKAPGAKSKLNADQETQIKDMIIGHQPCDYDLEHSLWTRQIVAELIQKEFAVKMGLTQVGKLLGRLRITPQKPTRQPREQDPEAVRKWREEEFPGILAEAEDNGDELFFMDEAGFRLDDQVGRTWGKCGETPVVKSTGKRGRVNSFTAMSITGGFWSEMFDVNLNGETFCDLLDQFMATRRKNVILIMDSHPAHTSYATVEHMNNYGSRLTFHYLPTYSPELNPVEYVNHYAKLEGPRKHLPQDKNELFDIAQNVIDGLKGAFAKVKRFFEHEELEYINI